MTTELQQKITEIETKLNEMRAQLAAMPDEPVTPVKWVPEVGKNYFYIDDGWAINTTHNVHGNRYDAARIARGNCYPTVRFQRTNKAATGLEIINYVDVFTRDYP